MSDRFRSIGLYALVAAVASIVVTPLFGLAYFATDEGREEMEIGSVAAWAEPARDAAGGLLTFAGPDRVYVTYLQMFALLCPAVLLTALAVRSRRPADAERPGRWAWRVALAGYGLLTAGVVAAAVALVGGDPSAPVAEGIFLAGIIPGILLSTAGSSALGIGFLRAREMPRSAAWLLALAFPLWLAGSFALGHNSLGLVPVMVGWGIAGLELARAGDRATARGLVTAGER